MNQDDRLEPTPEETGDAPSTPTNPTPPPTEPTPGEPAPGEPASAEPTSATEPPAEPTEEASAQTQAAPAPVEAPPAYRWTYAEQAAHDAAAATAKNRKGILIYAAVITGVFLVSFGLMLAVLIRGNNAQDSFGGVTLSPGAEDANDSISIPGVEEAKKSVVVIEVKKETGSGTATGIIMSADGYIATNHHVISGATLIKVTFFDGTVRTAQIIGSSEMDDLGVIKVSASNLPVATFANSEHCYVGQTVYAIGTPASPDFGWTTTKGIISFKDREVKMYGTDGKLKKKLRLLQTDANVNPGNSGGPLVNAVGQVVGVVSMRLSDGFEGIGFAIPSDGAIEILNAIIQYGNADSINSSLSHKRPMLGIHGAYLVAGNYYLVQGNSFKIITEEEAKNAIPALVIHPEVSGIYVSGYLDNMDAVNKLQVGDIITAAQGTLITSMNHLTSIVNEYYAGDTVTLTVYRNGEYIPVDVVLSPQNDS